MSEYHFYFDKDSRLRPTSKISNEPAPANLPVTHRSEGVGVAKLSAGHYVADLPENICNLLMFGMMQHYFVTKFEPSSNPSVPGTRRLQHILLY